MYQLKSLEDTIAAISTPAGQGGIGIVRLSGQKALSIADRIFVSRHKGTPSTFKSHTVHYGCIANKQAEGAPDEIIDEVLLTVMRSPRTYTREDIVEISCHGGLVPLKGILNMAVDSGARLAEPGEFTKRAFLNGRIDLTQAEAVLDIIQSKTDAFLKVSTNQLKGELTTELEAIRERLMGIYTEQEAIVNFPEDDIETQVGAQHVVPLQSIYEARERVEALLKSSEHGRILREGIKIVICGRTNVGKSSLLNVLLKQPRAIISETAGTTRDTIEEAAQIRGIPFQLVDTAGIITPRSGIEQEAVKRSHAHIKGADLVLLVLDASQKITKKDKEIIENVSAKGARLPDGQGAVSGGQGQNVLAVLNKCDLDIKIEADKLKQFFKNTDVVRISALQKTGIAELEEKIIENILHKDRIDTNGILVSNMRHIHSLKICASAIENGMKLLERKQPMEFVSEEIKQAVNALDSITGRNIDADLLDKIFSEFCVGK